MKGDFHPLMRWRDVDLVDGVLSGEAEGLNGCSGEQVSTLASLRKCPVSTITLFYILLTSILFTIPFLKDLF